MCQIKNVHSMTHCSRLSNAELFYSSLSLICQKYSFSPHYLLYLSTKYTPSILRSVTTVSFVGLSGCSSLTVSIVHYVHNARTSLKNRSASDTRLHCTLFCVGLCGACGCAVWSRVLCVSICKLRG